MRRRVEIAPKKRARSLMLATFAALARPLAVDGTPRADGAILLIRPDHLGDMLFLTPALRRLKAHLPNGAIHCLVGPWARDVVARSPHVQEVICCQFPWFDGRQASFRQRYGSLLAEARRLRRRRFAAAVNLRFDFWWGAALAFLAGVPHRLGYDISDCAPFLNTRLPYEPGRHEVLQNAALVDALCEAMGVPADNGELGGMEFPISAAERAFAKRYLAAHGASGKPLLVLQPGSRAPVKRWPEERFAALANALAPKMGAHVLVTGSQSERGLAGRIAAQITAPATVAAGDTTLGELAALLERADLVVGVDSGPLHLAVALERPTVHLFGPADHRRFGPFGPPGRHAVVTAGLSCSPCHRLDWPAPELPAHDCMLAITVEQVVQEADRILAGAGSVRAVRLPAKDDPPWS